MFMVSNITYSLDLENCYIAYYKFHLNTKGSKSVLHSSISVGEKSALKKLLWAALIVKLWWR